MASMNVLVAMHRAQGDAPGDDCWTTDDELVVIWDCPCWERCAVFSGVETHKVTTTAEVIERPDLEPSSVAYVLRQSWTSALGEIASADAIACDAADVAADEVGRTAARRYDRRARGRRCHARSLLAGRHESVTPS
jgi:hypothetical protein